MDSRLSVPEIPLLFFVAEADVDAEAVRDMLYNLSTARPWVLGPPAFIDTIDNESVTQPEDVPIRTLGGVLHLYTRMPPWNTQIPLEVDSAELEQSEFLIAEIERFSMHEQVGVEFELDTVYIGTVREGRRDRLLSEGFLGEWERMIALRRI